jgi:hypothetical protein
LASCVPRCMEILLSGMRDASDMAQLRRRAMNGWYMAACPRVKEREFAFYDIRCHRFVN